MNRQYVFLVHGMGLHPAGQWHESFKQSFLDAARLYSPYQDLEDSELEGEHFRFVPISYDRVFEGYRQRWQENSGGVRDQVAAENRDVGRMFEWLARSAAEEDGVEAFFWTHLLDPLLWFAFKEARMAVVAHVNKQIGDGLKEMYAEVGTNTAHVLAHSLGTSVVHDSLIALRFWPDHEGLFDPQGHQWRTIGMVANVSRLLETRFKLDPHLHREAFKPYRSVLNPGAAGSICQNFLNVHHRIDPFTWARRFHPGNWPTHAYTDIETTRFHTPTAVHDFEHYLVNPRVHIPALRLISGRIALGTLEEQTAAWNAFVDSHRFTASNEYDVLRSLFRRDEDKKLNVPKLAEFLYRVFQELMA